MTADPHLTFPVEANSVYVVRGQLHFKGSTAGDVKHGYLCSGSVLRAAGCVVGLRSASLDSVVQGEENGTIVTAGMLNAGSGITKAMTTGAYYWPVQFTIAFEVGATPGDFSVVWSQATADPSNPATLLKGALLTYEKMP